MAYNANHLQSPVSPLEVGSPETVQPHHMDQASRYLEEQYPKYYYEPATTPQLPELAAGDGEKRTELDGKTMSPQKTIFGIRPRFFVIAAVIILIVIAAAVGGGVGGSVVNKNRKSDSEAAEAASWTSSTDQEDRTEEASQTPPSVVTTTVTHTPTESTSARMVTTTRNTTPTKTTTEAAATSTEVCAEGTVADGESQNYIGLCKFSCGYGYCPPGPCTCVAYGKPKETPDVTNVRGCPLPELSDGYLGLCSFACNHGYCPETACTTRCDDR
ncbi:hypothetical protein F66182_971 [Fusarium sp. NRRL 66182]|nr:hypothetical protein F66182_971 [Fusarium sp. NRRL 66182]